MAVSMSSDVFQNPIYFSGNGAAVSSSLLNSGGLSTESLFNSSYLERKDGYEQTRESFYIARAGREAVIDKKIKNIISAIENGSEKRTMKAYASLLNEMSKQARYAQLKDGEDDSQLRAVARDLIESKSGVDLEDLIEENLDSAFIKEIKPDIEGCSYSQEDILKEMCDIDPPERVTKAKKIAGRMCKYAATGAVIGALVPIPFIGPISGALIGAGIGVGTSIYDVYNDQI